MDKMPYFIPKEEVSKNTVVAYIHRQWLINPVSKISSVLLLGERWSLKEFPLQEESFFFFFSAIRIPTHQVSTIKHIEI